MNSLDMEGKRVQGTWRGQPFTGTVERAVVNEIVEHRCDRIAGAYNEVSRSVTLVISLDRPYFIEWQKSHISISQQDIDNGISTVEVTP